MNIYDIAQRSGVSIATVSRVINGSAGVRQKTREKVLAVIKQEDYTPNIFARGLGLNSIRMIGILCTDVSDLYYAKAVSLVENCLREKGFDALLSCTGPELADKKKSLSLMLQKRVDAVILIGSAFREDADNSHLCEAARQAPVVIINGLVDLPDVYCVLCDEREATRENVSHLYLGGCRRILYLYDALSYSGGQKRDGYLDGIREQGLEAFECRVSKDMEAARKKVAELLQKGEAFDAVLASEDLLAIGAQKALADAGHTLPVIGFNNSTLARCASPELTSVDNMLDVLCPAAVNLLCGLLDGKPAPHKTVVSARLVERETFRKA